VSREAKLQKMLNQEKGRELHKQREKEEKEMLKREQQRDASVKATRDATAPDVVRKRDRDHAADKDRGRDHAADKERGRDREGGGERGKAKASARQQHVEEDAAKRRRVDAPQTHAATGHKATDSSSATDRLSDRATQASSAAAAASSSSSSRALPMKAPMPKIPKKGEGKTESFKPTYVSQDARRSQGTSEQDARRSQGTSDNPDPKDAEIVDPKDAEIAQLKRQLAMTLAALEAKMKDGPNMTQDDPGDNKPASAKEPGHAVVPASALQAATAAGEAQTGSTSTVCALAPSPKTLVSSERKDRPRARVVTHGQLPVIGGAASQLPVSEHSQGLVAEAPGTDAREREAEGVGKKSGGEDEDMDGEDDDFSLLTLPAKVAPSSLPAETTAAGNAGNTSGAVKRQEETQTRRGSDTREVERARERDGVFLGGADEALSSSDEKTSAQDKQEGAQKVTDTGEEGGEDEEEEEDDEEEEEDREEEEAGGLIMDEESEDDDVSLLTADLKENENCKSEEREESESELRKGAPVEDGEGAEITAEHLPIALEVRQPANAVALEQKRMDNGTREVEEDEDDEDEDEDDELHITDEDGQGRPAIRKRLRQADSDDEGVSMEEEADDDEETLSDREAGGSKAGATRASLAVARARALVKPKECQPKMSAMDASAGKDKKTRSRPLIASESDEDEDVPLAGLSPHACAKCCPMPCAVCVSLSSLAVECFPLRPTPYTRNFKP
jgi:hypothetical protein